MLGLCYFKVVCFGSRPLGGFMPKTKVQSVVFALMMVFVMVFCMTVYTLALGSGGPSLAVFRLAIGEMWIEYAIVFALIFFCVTPLSLRLAGKHSGIRNADPLLGTVAVQTFTVAMIVPAITLVATFLHGGSSDWLSRWIRTAAVCLPAAWFLQVFYAGPLVRFAFRALFRLKD